MADAESVRWEVWPQLQALSEHTERLEAAGSSLAAEKERYENQSGLVRRLLDERRIRITNAVEAIQLAAAAGSLTGQELERAVEQVTISSGEEWAKDRLDEAKEFAASLTPDALICSFNINDYPSLWRVGPNTETTPTAVLLLPKYGGRDLSINGLTLGYQVLLHRNDTEDDGKLRTLDPDTCVLGRENIVQKLLSYLDNQSIRDNYNFIENVSSYLKALRELGAEDEADNHQAVIGKGVEQWLSSKITINQLDTYDSILIKFLNECAPDSLRKIYDEQACVFAESNFSSYYDSSRNLKFASIYFEATVQDTREMQFAERNDMFLHILSNMNKRGMELLAEREAQRATES